jgi:hypothetical protein
MTGEPAIADIPRTFPHWEAWKGISGLLYARRRMTSPPVVLRAEDARDLIDQINGWEGRHGQSQP